MVIKMKKQIICILTGIGMAFSICATAGAESVKAFLTGENGKIEIKTLLSDEYIGKEVFIYVFNPGKAINDTKMSSYSDNIQAIQYMAQQEYKKGGITIDFTMNTDNVESDTDNIYRVFAVTEGNYVSADYTYYKKSDRDEMISRLNSEEITAALIDEAYEKFSMQNLLVYKRCDSGKMAANLKKIIAEYGVVSKDNVQKYITAAALLAAAEQGKITFDDIVEYNYILNIDDDYTSEYDNLTDNGKKMMTDNLEGIQCSTISDLNKEIVKSLLSALVYKNVNEGSGTLEKVIEKHKIFMNANGLDYLLYQNAKKDIIGRNVIGAGEKKYSDMIAIINAESKTNQLNNSSSAGGGGSSGGGTSNGGSSAGKSQTTVVSAVAGKPENVTFSDLDGVSWARESIEKLYQSGVVKGKGDGFFAPNDLVTREEFVKMISGAFDLPASGNGAGFSDVMPERWSYETISGAAHCGVISGYGGYFRPTETITREDMAVIIVRALKYKGYELLSEGYETGFLDENEISVYAKESVNVLYKNKLISGTDENMFLPKKNATRAEAAVMICNAMKYREE